METYRDLLKGCSTILSPRTGAPKPESVDRMLQEAYYGMRLLHAQPPPSTAPPPMQPSQTLPSSTQERRLSGDSTTSGEPEVSIESGTKPQVGQAQTKIVANNYILN